MTHTTTVQCNGKTYQMGTDDEDLGLISTQRTSRVIPSPPVTIGAQRPRFRPAMRSIFSTGNHSLSRSSPTD